MKTLGLIGKSLSHSFSKKYFEEKFLKENISDYNYLNFEISDISNITEVLKEENLVGFNVTIPYKEAILPFLNELSPEAEQVGAVNTVKISIKDGIQYLKGYNTDVFGFAHSIKPFLEGSHEKALVLGTGGASKAVAFVLDNLGIDVLYVSRKGSAHNVLHYDQLNEMVMKYCPLVINTTPVGTFPNHTDCPEIPYQYMNSSHLAVDLIYNPTETLFLQKAREKGAKTLNGLSMLHLQAERSWEIFKS